MNVTYLHMHINNSRPFDPRAAYNGSFRTSGGMKVPPSLDVISIDMIVLPFWPCQHDPSTRPPATAASGPAGRRAAVRTIAGLP